MYSFTKSRGQKNRNLLYMNYSTLSSLTNKLDNVNGQTYISSYVCRDQRRSNQLKKICYVNLTLHVLVSR